MPEVLGFVIVILALMQFLQPTFLLETTAWTTAGLLDALCALNGVVCDGAVCIWSIRTLLFIIAHSLLTLLLSFYLRRIFLYLHALYKLLADVSLSFVYAIFAGVVVYYCRICEPL